MPAGRTTFRKLLKLPGEERSKLGRARLVRHFLESRQAGDGKEGDVERFDSVAPRRECMTELVQHDTKKNQQDEQDSVYRSRASPCR